MKIAIEFIKIALLSAIVIIMGMNIGILQTPTSSETGYKSSEEIDLSEDSKSQSNQRETDLRKIMEHSLSQLFKFPESVRFRNTNYEYMRVLNDHGISVAPEKELEFATLCGQYSAQNAMAVYGSARPFYAEVAVNNEEKGITGDVWLEIDGEIKKLISLDSTIALDGDKEEFEELYSKNCGDIRSAFMGVFGQYDIGYTALSVKHYIKELDKLSKYPGAKESLMECSNSDASHDYCIGAEICQRVKELDENMSKFCSIKKQVCSGNDKHADCEAKLEAAYKEKMPSKK
ncbi:hypothetical protein [Thiohalophilus sp.]|uniref:hypothetical protein n=1 Tax=Thiohalophilus sp. TaxID=3028392 RepID=UPI002ACD52DC|nr:hypothetical protein [Thiohalophilus sp.]MDZ7660847.1 hypothetical protein [Thiohalophilus sp.]